MTSQQTGKRSMLNYGSLPEMYVEALTDAGHEVDHRRVEPGDSLKGYDVMIVGQAPLHSLGAYYLYPVLEAIGRARAEGVGLMFILDDWQLNNLMSGVRTVTKNTDRLFKGQRSIKGNDDPETFVYKKHRAWAVSPEIRPRIEAVVEAMRDRPWPATIVPKFAWGDINLMAQKVPARELIGVDMSPYTVDYGNVIPADTERSKKWIMGTLSLRDEWLEKQKLTWEVDKYGGPVRTSPYPRLPEPELLDKYTHAWGTVAPPYGHAGSGWYRHRFVHAMRTRCIMLVDKRDGQCIGPSWTVPANEIEQLAPAQLRELADAQYVEQAKLMWSKEQVQSTLVEAIERARV